MSIRSVVTRGYSAGGSIALVIVRGYGLELVAGGGDSSKRGLRLLMPDEQLDRQLKREDDEVLTIVIAMTESMN